MFKYACLNNISEKGLKTFTPEYERTEDLAQAQGILVRSAAMHDMEFSSELLAIARAGAGVNNIPVDRCAREGIVVFNTPGANANGVKEMVFAGMLLASRDIVEGVDWVRTDKGTATYAEGMNEQNAYHTADFLYGNRLETIPWDSDDAETLRERQKAANAELEVSKYFGFAVDATDVADTVAAVKNVVDTYYPPLSAGTVSDTDAQLEKFVSELYGAGMQTLLDTYQAQLDEWLASK